MHFKAAQSTHFLFGLGPYAAQGLLNVIEPSVEGSVVGAVWGPTVGESLITHSAKRIVGHR